MEPGVFIYPCQQVSSTHEVAIHEVIGRQIAALLNCRFRGNCVAEQMGAAGGYFIPVDTLVDDGADYWGNLHEENFFGGLVRQRWMATKAISHPLWGATDGAPPAWSTEFSRLAGDSVLQGYTTFNLADAQACATQLLRQGAVRLKIPEGKACKGQTLVITESDLDNALGSLSDSEVARCGLVIEENLTAVKTYSVGQINIAGRLASYIGTQRLTTDNIGGEAYGGSSLTIVRGGYDELQQLPLTPVLRKVIAQAQRYESAAFASFDGLMLSRRNYDVAQGLNAAGQEVTGVLEQSWRIGGASAAEIFGLRRLCGQPELKIVSASTLELYGQNPAVPTDATVLYQGDDAEVGFITKCVRVSANEFPD